MTDRTTKVSAPTGSHNLASLPPADRMRIEADKIACMIRWKCKGLKGAERQRQGNVLLAAVPEAARDAVVAALKARGAK